MVYVPSNWLVVNIKPIQHCYLTHRWCEKKFMTLTRAFMRNVNVTNSTRIRTRLGEFSFWVVNRYTTRASYSRGSKFHPFLFLNLGSFHWVNNIFIPFINVFMRKVNVKNSIWFRSRLCEFSFGVVTSYITNASYSEVRGLIISKSHSQIYVRFMEWLSFSFLCLVPRDWCQISTLKDWLKKNQLRFFFFFFLTYWNRINTTNINLF